MEKRLSKRLSGKQNLYEIIQTYVENMNSLESAKYKQTTNEIEKSSSNSEASKEKLF